MAGPVLDTRERPLRDLRVSVIDRCNFRCTYCMPKDAFGRDHAFLPHTAILSFEEIARVTRLFAQLGATKVRLTGGEPLLRRDLPVLVAMLAHVDGVEDLALTTNGSSLARHAAALAEAGLRRVTVSLDALDDEVFRGMNDVDFPVARVLEGIDAAADAGLGPIKVNMVVQRGVNEHEIVPMARYFRDRGHVLRFIEYMDVGHTNGWQLEQVLTGAEVLERLREHFDLEPVAPAYRGEVARRWRHAEGGVEIGLVTSVSRPFCGDCTRARLSADGHLYTCLFASTGRDLRPLLRGDADDDALREVFATTWRDRDDRYSEQRRQVTDRDGRVEMSYIGG